MQKTRKGTWYTQSIIATVIKRQILTLCMQSYSHFQSRLWAHRGFKHILVRDKRLEQERERKREGNYDGKSSGNKRQGKRGEGKKLKQERMKVDERKWVTGEYCVWRHFKEAMARDVKGGKTQKDKWESLHLHCERARATLKVVGWEMRGREKDKKRQDKAAAAFHGELETEGGRTGGWASERARGERREWGGGGACEQS